MLLWTLAADEVPDVTVPGIPTRGHQPNVNTVLEVVPLTSAACATIPATIDATIRFGTRDVLVGDYANPDFQTPTSGPEEPFIRAESMGTGSTLGGGQYAQHDSATSENRSRFVERNASPGSPGRTSLPACGPSLSPSPPRRHHPTTSATATPNLSSVRGQSPPQRIAPVQQQQQQHPRRRSGIPAVPTFFDAALSVRDQPPSNRMTSSAADPHRRQVAQDALELYLAEAAANTAPPTRMSSPVLLPGHCSPYSLSRSEVGEHDDARSENGSAHYREMNGLLPPEVSPIHDIGHGGPHPPGPSTTSPHQHHSSPAPLKPRYTAANNPHDGSSAVADAVPMTVDPRGPEYPYDYVTHLPPFPSSSPMLPHTATDSHHRITSATSSSQVRALIQPVATNKVIRTTSLKNATAASSAASSRRSTPIQLSAAIPTTTSQRRPSTTTSLKPTGLAPSLGSARPSPFISRSSSNVNPTQNNRHAVPTPTASQPASAATSRRQSYTSASPQPFIPTARVERTGSGLPKPPPPTASGAPAARRVVSGNKIYYL